MWKSRWPSWAPVPNKPTVSVDVKQHSAILVLVLLLLLSLMTIGHKAGHRCHFRILRSVDRWYMQGGELKIKINTFLMFSNLLGIYLLQTLYPDRTLSIQAEGVSWGSKDVTRPELQGSLSSTITLVWRASKYNVIILYLVTSFERCITNSLRCSCTRAVGLVLFQTMYCKLHVF